MTDEDRNPMNSLEVWKFVLELIDGPQVMQMPEGSEVLCVAMQHQRPTLWARVDARNGIPAQRRVFTVRGTGHPAATGEYVGTAVSDALVWHVFEVTS